MRSRVFLGLSFAVFMVAACGGSAELGDDFPGGGNDDAGGDFFDDGGVSTGYADGGTFYADASYYGDGGIVIVDAGFGGDGGRRHHDGGVGGFDGGFFFDGGVGPTDAGVTPPPPVDSGAQPPRDAGTFGGAVLRDANGVVLGEIVSIQSEGAVFTIVTSNDYVVDLNFDGTYAPPSVPGSLLYSGADCSGSIFLQGSTSPTELLGSTVIYSSLRGLLLPAGPLTSGAATSSPVSWQSVGDPCENDGKIVTGFDGWPLVPTTAANIGLPDTIAAPLSYP